MTIAELFESRKNDPRWNTSYPLSPNDWAIYRVSDSLPFDHDSSLSFYIHIPFCKQLCSFCEYTRMLCPDESVQTAYLQAIAKDIKDFKSHYKDYKLLGFDIGGGTPTSLSEDNFSLLMDVYQRAIDGLVLSDNYEPSIEATFGTLSEAKLACMVKNGLRRLSLGVQSSCHSIMYKHYRDNGDECKMSEWMEKAWNAGVKKVNLDFMYGLQGQDVSSIAKDLELISRLHPQQVTLYELRTNMLGIKEQFSKEELFAQYVQYYDGLMAMGYHARFGQNTFSVDNLDYGVSSYLRERMLNGSSYKGFGMSAQSMSTAGVSYNYGKQSRCPELNRIVGYKEEYTYILPPKELISKYMAISAYSGSFSVKRLIELGVNEETLNEVLDYAFSSELLYMGANDRVYVTRKGFVNYGALFSLFSNRR